ncbi:hypothetical protein M0R19_08070 [Candidatus Pacearchaeota archaeon]|nr:hypothetical protein [Candidatus Pacearchaeota archaeon]
MSKDKKINIVKILKKQSRDEYILPSTKKFKDKKKYDRKKKHKIEEEI